MRPLHPKPKPLDADDPPDLVAKFADQRPDAPPRGSTPTPVVQPFPKPPPASPKARLTARQCQLMRRLPLRPSKTDLEALSDSGLRVLMKVNGLPRSRDQRRADYVAAIAAWLAGDSARMLAFPETVERPTEGEPAPPAAPTCPPPPPPPIRTCTFATTRCWVLRAHPHSRGHWRHLARCSRRHPSRPRRGGRGGGMGVGGAGRSGCRKGRIACSRLQCGESPRRGADS